MFQLFKNNKFFRFDVAWETKRSYLKLTIGKWNSECYCYTFQKVILNNELFYFNFSGYHFSLWQGLRADPVHLLLMICFYNCLTIIPFEHVCWIITMQTVGLRVNKPVLILLVVVAHLELNFVWASINFCRFLCRCKHEFRWLIEFGLKFSSKFRLIRVLCWLLGICNILKQQLGFSRRCFLHSCFVRGFVLVCLVLEFWDWLG